MRDNHALDNLIEGEVNKTDDSIHPSMRRWKETRNEAGEKESGNCPTSQEGIDEQASGECKYNVVAFFFVVFFVCVQYFYFRLRSFLLSCFLSFGARPCVLFYGNLDWRSSRAFDSYSLGKRPRIASPLFRLH